MAAKRTETRLERLLRLRKRAWAGMWQRENSFAAIHWWAMWWYRLDDAFHAERWK